MPEIYRTCLEKQMYGYLVEMGFTPRIDFCEQHAVCGYVLDFAFIQSRKPFHGLDIEVDGLPWHSTSKQRQRDGFRTYKLMRQGWLVERFGEIFTTEDVAAVLEKHGIKPS